MGLTEIQKQELQRCFSVFDRDGSGEINKAELAQVLQALHPDLKPSAGELDKIMELMDQNKDGIIQYDEFLAVMEEWLQSETENSSSGKRKRTLSDSREEVQKKISKFFLQFSKSQKFDETRQSLGGDWGKLSTLYGTFDKMVDENLEEQEVKLRLLKNTNIKDLALEINTAKNPQDATVSVQKALDIFSILDYYTTPSKRREIGEELLFLFECFASVTPRLIGYLKVENSPMLQLVSLKVLSYIVEGPKISSTPLTHAFHPSKMFFKQKIKEEKGLSTIIDQFLTPKYREIYPVIVEEVMGFIGNFSRDNETARDYLLDNGALKPMLEMFAGVFAGNEPRINLIRKTTWALSIFCGSSHTTVPNINFLKDALPVLTDLLLVYGKVYTDEDILMNLYLCLTFLLPGFSVGESLIQKILDLLTSDSIPTIQMTLALINKLVHMDQGISKAFVNQNLIGMCKILIINKNREVVLAVLGILSTLVGLRGEIGSIIEADLIPAIVGYANNSDYVRWRCVKILKYLTRGLNVHVKYLVQKENVVACLCNQLSFFESHDDVLKSIYNYVGSSYNFEMIRDALIALNGIILAGEIECEQNENTKLNPFAEYFNFESCFKIGKLVQKIKESKDVTPWKVEKGGISIEDTCKGLLVKICEVSSTFKTVEAQKVSNLIIEILSQIYGKDVFNEFKLQNTNFFKQFKERRSKLALILDSKVGYDDSIHFGDSIDITKREATIKKTLFEDILKLSKDNNVAVTPQEINTLFEWWKTKCDSEARVSKADFKQGLEEKFGIRDKMALEQYYFQFDPKSVGFVDFREFVIGLAVLNKQKKIIQQKEAEDNVLKMFFRIYDLDGNGYITMEELYSLLKNIKDAQGVRYSIDDLKAFTIQKFREIDRDGNGKIDFDEFKDAVISKKLPVPTELNKN